MNIKNQLIKVLPNSVKTAIEIAMGNMWESIEEIRIYYPGSL